MIKHIKNHQLEYSFIFGFIIILIAVLLFAKASDDQWNKFVIDHECKVIGQDSGDALVAITSNGTLTTGITTPKTQYICDDNITYWR